jgi:hypothetical protein
MELLLDRLRQKFHQCQAPRYPTHTAVKPPCRLLQPITEALLQLCPFSAIVAVIIMVFDHRFGGRPPFPPGSHSSATR